ncbi:MAG: homocitrate synthase/isopropylmalate synthase family protein [Ruminiclostridium sp.]
MIRITDVTLCSLNNKAAPKRKLLELYQLLLKTGINFIEINVPIYMLLRESVDLNKTILRVQDPTEIKYYPGFVQYICRYSGFDTQVGTISEIQVNDIREVNLMNKFSEYQNIRIVGLDDLLLHDYITVFDKINKIINGRIELCPQNSYYCASALATEWVLNGGENIVVSFFGCGGFAALEEVVMALRITKRHRPNLDLSVFVQIKTLYEELTGENIPKNKAVIGSSIFEVESGIHVDGIFKNGSNYEPFEPAVVGMERKVIVGKHSGSTTIEIKLQEYDIAFPQNMVSELLKSVQQESIRLKRSITDQEFVALAKDLIK